MGGGDHGRDRHDLVVAGHGRVGVDVQLRHGDLVGVLGGDLLKDDKRWAYGTPPAGNANFAWVQHFIWHLAPTGLAGFVLANGSMSSNQSGEGEIRKNLIEADLVDCMVALPGQLFYSTQIPSASGSSLGTRRMADSATGAVTRTQASMPTCQASASAPRWTTSASTATCSRPAANLKELGYGG